MENFIRKQFHQRMLGVVLLTFTTFVFAKAQIDKDVIRSFDQKQGVHGTVSNQFVSLLVFLHTNADQKALINTLSKIPNIKIQSLQFMPAVALTIPTDRKLLDEIANHPAAAQITSNPAATEELDVTAQAIKLAPSTTYPEVSNWWAHGYNGHSGVIGIIDEGVDPLHPSLANKKIVSRQEGGSHYSDYLNGLRTAHGTGVSCIYASEDPLFKGMAYGATTIVNGLSGAETPDTSSIMLTMSSLDWMLNRAGIKPTIINYSMGNGRLACPDCPEWSGLAKVVDYVVNQEKILWVKSAGNLGYIEATQQVPFASTLTVPGDNYNALTIANMNLLDSTGLQKTANRADHSIRSTSSRGPTPSGRRKPDLTAPGHDTRTCAPDPQVYGFHYTPAMAYHDGYRLMGGTSSAAPHVGASALLIQDAGIQNPMAVKALLINSADAWTDSGQPGPGSQNGHFQVMGSEWSRTYGWGYINMETAFAQRNDVLEGQLSVEQPVKEYETTLDVGEKITLVHERRVGYSKDGNEWKLSHLSLEVIDKDTKQVITSDTSAIDTVHQVANCERSAGKKVCSPTTKPTKVIVRVALLSKQIDGSNNEPFALVLKQK